MSKYPGNAYKSGRKPRPTPAGGPASKSAASSGAASSASAGDAKPGRDGPMSVPLLESLVQIMSSHGLVTMELQEGESRIYLSRAAPAVPAPAPAPAPPAAQAPSGPPAPTPAQPPAATPAETAGDLLEVKSPMVGTYYASASPDAKAFVQVGDKVGPDTDVCIIEAMKVFNTIKAEVSGTIDKILVDNGAAVEYGQALFLVKP